MIVPLSLDFELLDPANKRQVNEICESFEEALQQGLLAHAEEHLGASAEPLRSLLLRELLLLECEYRLGRAEPVSEQELVQRLPGRESLVRAVLTEARANGLRDTPSSPQSVSMAQATAWLEATKRFRIQGVLGRGGFGLVFQAEAPDLGGPVAVKTPLPGALPNPELRARFLREARAAARLDHPHIVRVLDVGEAGPLCYLVTAYVPGPNLAQWLRAQETGVPVRVAAEIVQILAIAIHFAHQAGVLHCDLKPGNVLMGPGPGLDPKVTDFGLAQVAGDPGNLTRTGQVLGTPLYMAPEQAAGERRHLRAQTDVYSLGTILYELLVGHTPFPPGPAAELLYRVLHEDPPAPRIHRPDISPELQAVCLRCLEKDPGKRYATAAGLADDLGRFLQGQKTRARPIRWDQRVWRWCRRRPGTAGLLAALLGVLVGGIAGIVVQWQRAEASEAQALEVLGELLQSTAALPMQESYFVPMPTPETLRKAEAHCENYLRLRPGDTRRRIALTKVRGGLATLYLARGQGADADACLQGARDLWEPLAHQHPANATFRGWLATVHCWQAYAARFQGHYTQAMQSFEQAYVLWEELAEEQPEGPLLWQQVPGSSENLLLVYLTDLRTFTLAGQNLPRLLEESRTHLGKRVREVPSSTVHRTRLALTCILLGKIYSLENAETKARPCWQQAHEHYRILTQGSPDDLQATRALVLCCYQLMGNRPDDPYYVEAVVLYEQAGQRLARFVDQQPENTRFLKDLLVNYRDLLACHQKAGQTTRAERLIRDHLQDIIALARTHPFDPALGVILLQNLINAAHVLRVVKQPGAALEMTREAVALADQCRAFHWRNLSFSNELASQFIQLAALLRLLKEPAAAVRQAELGRRLYQEFRRTAPDDLSSLMGLAQAWTQIGKARWDLGQVEEALAALRESAAVQRQVFEREPLIRANRIILSRCYDRIVHWGGLCGKRAEAAAALLEREKLWPDNAKELQEVALDFEDLAKAVGAFPVLEASTVGNLSAPLGQGPLLAAASLFPGRNALDQANRKLTPGEQAERQRYIDHGERAKRAAKAAADSVKASDRRKDTRRTALLSRPIHPDGSGEPSHLGMFPSARRLKIRELRV